MTTDKFPNIFVASLARSLSLGGSDTDVYLSSIRTLDGQPMTSDDFKFLGRAILSVDVQSATRAEFISFTGVDAINSKVTGCVRGLSFKDDSVIPANKKFHSVGAPVIIAFGTHDLIDLEQKIQQALATQVFVVGKGSGNSGTSSVSSLTYTVPVSGSNRGVVVGISCLQSVTVTAVTVGGISCTKKKGDSDSGSNIRSEQWLCVAPPRGVQSVIITLSGASTISSDAASVINLNQTTPVGGNQSGTGTGSTASISLTTIFASSSIIDCLATKNSSVSPTPDSSQQLISQNLSGTNQNAVSIKDADSVGDYPMSYALGASVPWVYTAIELNPSGEVAVVDYKVKATSADTTPGYVTSKVNITSANSSVTVTKTITNPAGDEVITFDLASMGGMGGGIKIAVDPATETVTTPDGSGVTQTLYTVTIPGGTLGVDNAIYFRAIMSSLQIYAPYPTAKSVKIRAKYGGTTIAEAVATYNHNISGSNSISSSGTIEGVILANTSASSQKGAVTIVSGIMASGYGTSSIDSTVDQDLVIEAYVEGYASGAGGSTVTTQGVIVEQITDAGSGGGTIQPFTLGESVSVNDYVFESDGSAKFSIIPSVGSFSSYINLTTATTSIGVPFSPARSGSVSLSVFLMSGLSISSIRVAIFAASAGIPTGSALGYSDYISFADGNVNPREFPFSSPVSVSAGSNYIAVIDTSIMSNSPAVPLYYPGVAAETNDGGTTWYTPIGSGVGPQSAIYVELPSGVIFKVDPSLSNMGPYKGFMLQSGSAGDSKNVQIGGIIGGFTGLTTGLNVFNDPSTPGAITQTPGITAGRAVGIAVSATQIQIAQMRKRSAGQSYTGGTISQDGFLVGTVSSDTVPFGIVENDGAGTTTTVFSIGASRSGSGTISYAISIPFTVPVRAGCSYNAAGTFYPLING